MKKCIGKILAILLSAACLLPVFSGCSGNRVTGNTEEIDPERTQLYVHVYDGGFGTEYMYKIKERFEAAYANESYEADKTGVQVMIDKQKSSTTLESVIESSPNDVFFVELANMPLLIDKGLLLDISDVVTEDLTEYGENESIEGKMEKSQRDYMSKDGKYYAIPHYEGFWGITYNVDLFEDNLLYFSADPKPGSNGFIVSKDEKRSAGPDGNFDTEYDNGLPATYEELYALCDRMKTYMNISPFGWTGQYASYVNTSVAGAFWADYEGADSLYQNWSFSGPSTTIVKDITADGKVILEEDVTINSSKGYLTYRQAGKYYALTVLEKIIDSGWTSKNSFITTQSNLMAQSDYLRSGIEPGAEKIAFYCDGSWWPRESTSVFNDLAELYPTKNTSQKDRRIAWFPLPKADSSKVDEKITMVDGLWSTCFIKSNIEEFKIDLAKEFLRFCNTDESLQEFTTTTNATKALDYDLTQEQYESLSYYGKSLWNIVSQADIVRPYSTNPIFLNYAGTFFWGDQWDSTPPSGTYNYPSAAMNDDKVSAIDYFKGMMTNYSESKWRDRYSQYFD